MSSTIIKVLKSHTGHMMLGGAISLKAAALTGSWLFICPGYSLLILACGTYILKWRDRHDHKN